MTMEINITSFFNSADPSEFSASIAETGYSDIGKRTWASALAYAPPLLTTPEELEALREYVKDFGAWDDEEIAAWSDAECNALFIQLISGDMREGDLDADPDEIDWPAYEKRCEAGQCSGNIFKAADGTIYYSLSH